MPVQSRKGELPVCFTKGGQVGDEVTDIFVPKQCLWIHGCAGVAAFDRTVAVFVVLRFQRGGIPEVRGRRRQRALAVVGGEVYAAGVAGSVIGGQGAGIDEERRRRRLAPAHLVLVDPQVGVARHAHAQVVERRVPPGASRTVGAAQRIGTRIAGGVALGRSGREGRQHEREF
mgnify:CR=1 FL=1